MSQTHITRRSVLPVVLIAGATVVTLAPVLGDGGRWDAVGAALVVVCLASAVRLRSAPAVRALLVLALLYLVLAVAHRAGLPPAVGTLLSCVVPLGVLLGCERSSRLRPAAAWLRTGTSGRGMVLFGGVTVVLTAAALVTWTQVVQPPAPAYLADLQERPVWVGVAGIAAFALVNPIWEELVFRGVLLHELEQLAGSRTAVVLQAVLFGAAHWAGFPSGWAGSVMAAGWGLALGVIRVRTGGMLLPYAVHAAADATIGVLALVLLV